MNFGELLEKASLAELKNGYIEEQDSYRCLACGRRIEKGVIYRQAGVLYEAPRFMRIHIEEVHGSVFDFLIRLDKKFTGLTEHQNSLLKLFYLGKSDEEVKREMKIGSAATIRNHRFVLKEKERQARVFLTLMELLKTTGVNSASYISASTAGKTADQKYALSAEENEKILKKYFPHGLNGPLQTLHMKEKSKLAVLRQIADRFEVAWLYNEKEVNEILKTVHDDFVTLRRYLIEYGFMDRVPDGSRYWLKENLKEREESESMDRKKALKEQYKEMKIEAGIYQIRNTRNKKVFVAATRNLKTINGKVMQLRGGGHTNKQLQEDWNLFGEEAFVFEVLEVLEEKEEGYFDTREELKKLEAKWLEKLQPYGERGYHQPGKGRKPGA